MTRIQRMKAISVVRAFVVPLFVIFAFFVVEKGGTELAIFEMLPGGATRRARRVEPTTSGVTGPLLASLSVAAQVTSFREADGPSADLADDGFVRIFYGGCQWQPPLGKRTMLQVVGELRVFERRTRFLMVDLRILGSRSGEVGQLQIVAVLPLGWQSCLVSCQLSVVRGVRTGTSVALAVARLRTAHGVFDG